MVLLYILFYFIDEYIQFTYPSLYCTMLFPSAYKCYCYTDNNVLNTLAFGLPEIMDDNKKEIQSEIERLIQKSTRNITKMIGRMVSEDEKKCNNIERNITQEIYPVIKMNNNYINKEMIDYGGYLKVDTFELYLTNEYCVMINVSADETGPYIQRNVYEIEMKEFNDIKDIVEINIKNIKEDLSGVIASDRERYSGTFTEICGLDRKFYTCSELKKSCDFVYETYCANINPIDHRKLSSIMNITLFDNKIIIGDYILNRISSNRIINMVNNRTINSYSLPLRSSFILDDYRYFASDHNIGNVSVKENNEMNVTMISNLNIIHYGIILYIFVLLYS